MAMFSVAAVLAVGLTGCGADATPTGTVGTARGEIDAARGTYAHVSLGDRRERVLKVFGPPVTGARRDRIAFPGYGPSFIPADSPALTIYRDVTLTFVHDRVAYMSVYGHGAHTNKGIALGDSSDAVAAAYPAAQCLPERSAAPGDSEVEPVGPDCEAWFGGPQVRRSSLCLLRRRPGRADRALQLGRS